MPDGSQQNPRTSFNTTFQPASVLDHPGVTKPNGGVARAIAFARGMSGKAVVLALGVFALQAVMPPGSKPSDLIGSFHGSTETAEIRAKQQAAAEYERRLADAKAAPPADWQMEGEAFRQQQQRVANSLATQETAANLADAACFSAPFITALFGDTKDTRDLRDGMKQGCAAANAIRQNMVQEQAKAAREGSALVPRSNPSTGAGSEPAAPASPLGR